MVQPATFPETMHDVVSVDGTGISYRQSGTGPGLVILHGGGRASQHYRQLASLLADSYTVYIPDRRGRGLSGPTGSDYRMKHACEDVIALMEATGARLLFGHSGGGAIALETALMHPVEALMLYEPAVSINGSLPTAWLSEFEQCLNRNDAATAMAIFIRALEMNWMSRLPIWALKPLFRLMLKGPEAREIVELLHTLPPEVRLIEPLDSQHERYRAIRARTLLLGGSKSPLFLRTVLPPLASIIPHARLVELPGLDHSAPEEEASATVAAMLRSFLEAPVATSLVAR